MSIGKKVRKLRLQKRWSQEELAEYLNVAQTSVSNIEANKTIPDFLVMQKICNVFEVDFEYFVRENDNKTTVENAENCNIGCETGVINNNFPEGVLENMLKRIVAIEEKLNKQ